MFTSIAEWFETAERNGTSAPETVLRREAKETGADEAEIRRRVAEALDVMRAAVQEGLAIDEPSPSGLTGGRARQLASKGPELMGPTFNAVLSRAIATLEVNARMGLIMATPTAGAAGVVPAVLFTLQERRGWTDDQLVDAMLVAGGVGAVIAERASIAGAGGGCQAETGSAAAMAAAAVTWLEGGSREQVAHAIGLTLQGMLGLICDPVAGPVEMGEVGRKMDVRYRETALGGLAATPAGQEIAAAAGMERLVQLQRKGRTAGESSARIGPS